jgi:UDP-N-acetylglucosamine--N-acetylmuramyl-(pentapeptide) pyrophosphoryl-undecaprenol N-acetylglucosamine transferase
VISRAGNNVISELSALSKPTILIPLDSSANNHQVENARIISRMGAGIMMLQEHLSPEKLIRQIDFLMEAPEDLREMGEKLHALENKDAARVVAEEVHKLGEEFARKFEDENPEK